MSFNAKCEELGIELLREDIIFIKQRLKRIPIMSHKDAMRRYVDLWYKTMCECDNVLKGMNLGRSCANGYLRELSNK